VKQIVLLVSIVTMTSLFATPLAAHCDAVDGPVAVDARRSLESGELTPTLKWITVAQEQELAAAFEQARAARAAGEPARQVADRWFIETTVRLHRQSEGAPYVGLKAAGTDFGPAVKAADVALASGSAEELKRMVAAASATGLQQRFDRVVATRAKADESAEAGRKYVAAYADFVHYAKGIWEAGQARHSHSGHPAGVHEHAAAAGAYEKAAAGDHDHSESSGDPSGGGCQHHRNE
jgi:hypothetical protein